MQSSSRCILIECPKQSSFLLYYSWKRLGTRNQQGKLRKTTPAEDMLATYVEYKNGGLAWNNNSDQQSDIEVCADNMILYYIKHMRHVLSQQSHMEMLIWLVLMFCRWTELLILMVSLFHDLVSSQSLSKLVVL
jgi:hypothetical protein